MVVKDELDRLNEANMLDTGPKTQAQVTFVQALNDKYVDQDEIDDQFKLPKDSLITSEITFVGFGKVSSIQKQLRNLLSIDLSSSNIDSAGELDRLGSSLNRVRILNLAHNNLQWSDIIKILPYLTNLQELVLTGNRLSCPPKAYDRPIRRISLLIVGQINLRCDELLLILSNIWTCIDQLDIWNNSLTDDRMRLEPVESRQLLKSITSLKLSHNKLVSLDWINSGWLVTRLSELDLSNCELKAVKLSPEALESLQHLETLNISYNLIAEWSSVSNLNSLASLKSLMCTDNPFYVCEKMAKLFTIARVSKLKKLNREEITPTIRRDAEIFYLRKVYSEYRDFKEGRLAGFSSMHPRFEELATEYGLPEDLDVKKADDKYLTVQLCHENQSVIKKLPCDMRISNLQMLCRRLFKISPSSNVVIIYTKPESSGEDISYPLDKEGQTLHFFSLENDCKLRIQTD